MLGLQRRYTNEFSKGQLSQILLAMTTSATSFRSRLTESQKEPGSKTTSRRAQVSSGGGMGALPRCQEPAALCAWVNPALTSRAFGVPKELSPRPFCLLPITTASNKDHDL